MTTAGPLAAIVAALDGAAIPHMLVGSFASSAHGAVRSTQDSDRWAARLGVGDQLAAARRAASTD